MTSRIPNIYTGLRFVTIPAYVYFAYMQQPVLFVVFLFISWFIDTTDGTLARMLESTTELGHKIDTVTDYMNVFAVIAALYTLVPGVAVILPYVIMFILVYAGIKLLSWVRFRKLLFFHSWAGRLLLHIGILTIIVGVLFEFYRILVTLTAIAALSFLVEELLITLKLREPREDVNSIFEIL